MSEIGLKTGNLDLQGQIGLETINRGNFTFKLELCIDHLKVFGYSKKFVTLTLTFKVKLAFKLAK